MTPAEELMVRRLCRRLHRLGERASEEFVLELICRCSWRRPIVGRLTEFCDRLEAAGGRRTLDALGVNPRFGRCTWCGSDETPRPATKKPAGFWGETGGCSICSRVCHDWKQKGTRPCL